MRAIQAMGLFGLGCALCGCGSEPLRDDGMLGSVAFELVNAPAEAACAQLTAVGAGTSETRAFSLAPGAPAVFTAAGLPLGQVTLSEQVFTVHCDSVASSTPKWESDEVEVELEPGEHVDVIFTLHEVGEEPSVTAHTAFPESP